MVGIISKLSIDLVLFMMSSFLILSLINIPLISSLKFEFSRFDAELTDIAYQGDATPNGQGAIQLTLPNSDFRVGWASYSKKVPIWDPKTGQVADFTTHFSFIIDTGNRPVHGNGLAFFMAPFGSLIPPNSAGEYFGLLNTTTSTDTSKNQFIAVEFETAVNTNTFDIDEYQHVSIDVNTLSSVNKSAWNASVYSGNIIDVWIAYNSSTTDLIVNWANKTESNSTLTHKVDLKTVLPQWVMVGFTATTSLLLENHLIQSWKFSSSLDIKEQSGTTRRRSHIKLILGLSLSIGLIFLAILAITLKATCKSKNIKDNLIPWMNHDIGLERGFGPQPFSYADLALATDNFLEAHKLGEGGFGSVYKGYLTSLDLLIAVKKISKGSKQGKKEYETEVKVISQLRHRNLVQLIGWCHDHRDEFLLVYEFMPNGSLDVHLFGKKPVLNWVTRHKIALGLASALLYLHEEWEQCVIHRDIKSSNIMLDSNFNVKLGDFGLARLADHEHGPDTTGLAGTLGYMAPECLRTGRASKESDVYSFGVVILEIVTGRRCRGAKLAEIQTGLVEWVWDLYGKGKVLYAVDERLNRELNGKEVECLVIVGLWCAHPDPNLRPPIKQATRVLHFESSLPNLPSKMPIPTYYPPTDSSTSIVTSHGSLTSSSSMQVGR